jgi:hypothetical protein
MSRGFIPLVWVSILLLLLFSLGCGGVAHNSGGSGGGSGGTSGGNGGNPPAILIAISPTAADGHVYVGTGTELDIYGLLPE